MDFDDFTKVVGRVVHGLVKLVSSGIRKGAFKLQEPFVGGDVKERFNKITGVPLVPIENLNSSIDADLDPNYFTSDKTFRPGCGKCEAEVLGRTLILTSIKDGKWHAVPWPILALAHHGGGEDNIWRWMSSSYRWQRTRQNVENLAKVTRIGEEGETVDILNFDGQEWSGRCHELNGLHHFMPLGIDVLINAKLVTVVNDNGLDLIVPTTELVKRAQSSALLNNR